MKPLSPIKHYRAPIPHVSGTDETSGLFARSVSDPLKSSCSSCRPGRLSVSISPESLEDVQSSLLPIQRICQAAGLEAAVTSWWRKPRCSVGRSPKAERKEDIWLRSAVLSGAAEKVRQKLAMSGIPETVIDGGFQLGHFIAEDPEMQEAYESHLKEANERTGEPSNIFGKNPNRSNPRVEFVGRVVSDILRRYDLIYQAPLPSEEAMSFQQARLTLAPKPPTTPSKVAGSRRPKPSLESTFPIKQAGFPMMPRPGWETTRSAQEDTLRIPFQTRSSVPSPEQEDDDVGPPTAASKTPSSVMTADLEVTAVTAPSPLAKTLKLLDDAGDDRRSTATPRSGVRASISSSQGSAATSLDTRKNRPRGTWHASRMQTQLPSTTPTPSSARQAQSRFTTRAMTADLNDISNTPQLAQTTPGSIPPYTRRFSLNVPGTTRRTPKPSSSFDKWSEFAEQVSNEKQIVERQATTSKVMEKKAAHPEGVYKPSQTIVPSRKGFQKVSRDHGELRRVYDSFDKDGSGCIEPEEFLPLLAKLLRQPAETLDKQEVWRNWDSMDADGGGTITYDEFLKWYCTTFDMDAHPDMSSFITEADTSRAEKMIRDISGKMQMDVLKVEKLYVEFKKLDEDNSGVLEFEEFKSLVTSELSPTGNPGVPAKVMDKFWMEIDADGSGGVSFDEFVSWYMKFFYGHKSPMEQYYEILGKRGS